MKPRTVTTKIKQLVKRFGDKKTVAEKLDIDASYIGKLEKGIIPGVHLYREICRLSQTPKN